MDFLRVCITGLLLSLSTLISAGTVSGLYSTDIAATADQQAPTQTQIIAGLKQVLIKVSGSRGLDANPIVKQKYPVAETLLQQFVYKESESGEGAVVTLQYDREAINNLIQQAGIKPLGTQRPTLLVWLVSDQTGSPDHILSHYPEIQILRNAASSRGLSLQLPLLDLSDQAAMPAGEIWGLFEGSIKAASKRYKPDAIAAVKLQSFGVQGVQLNGLLLDQAKIEPLSANGDVNAVLTQMVNEVADHLLEPVVNYKLSHFQAGVAINVSNITSLSDYNLLTRFLEELPVVKKVVPERVYGSEVTLRLQLEGSEQQLIQSIGMELRLNAIESLRNLHGLKILSYRWQG